MYNLGLYIFTNDLRVNDNNSLNDFLSKCKKVILVYVYDTKSLDCKNQGKYSKWFLDSAILNLDAQIENKLLIFEEDLSLFLPQFSLDNKIEAIGWSRMYTPVSIERFTKLKINLKKIGLETFSYSGNLLIEPWNVLKKDGTPYKVYTPFLKHGYSSRNYEILERREMQKTKIQSFSKDKSKYIFKKMSQNKDFFLNNFWDPSEEGANSLLQKFLDNKLSGYQENRNFPYKEATSNLSPYLHFGLISPSKIVNAVFKKKNIKSEDKNCLYSEIVWREFSWHLLYHFPYMENDNFQKKFNHFKWQKNKPHLSAWKEGKTGFPIIDAGINELLTTGFMHNRVRMIVASFLAKNLLIDWREGRDFFDEYLCDADIANNTSGWQWVAGSGVDAAPYFRVFNPILQSKKFDPNGEYIKKHLPVLSNLPRKHIHDPSSLSEEILNSYGVVLGENYFFPIVDLKVTRARALKYYSHLSK